MNKQLLKMLSFMMIILLLLALGACQKKETPEDVQNDFSELPERENVEPQNDEQITVEQAVFKALDKLSISPKDITKLQKEDGIYFYIPLDKTKEIDLYFADMVMIGQIELTGSQITESIRDENSKVIREFYDKVHRQNYVVEIYYSDVKPGFEPSERKSKVAYLAVIVDDFGNYGSGLLDEFADSDPAITFAVIPGLPHSKIAMQKALDKGHEVIVHIPMQADNPKANPGKNAILETMGHDEIVSLMNSYFKELPYAVGANQHMGSKISANKKLMEAVLSVIDQKKLFFIDSKTTARSVAYKTALEMNIPSAERNLFLDAPANSDEIIEQRLNDLKKLKESHGKALVITHCHDKSRLDRLNRFIQEAENMGFELVPVSKYVALEPDIF